MNYFIDKMIEKVYHVYTLTCRCDKVYVGSTGDFDMRMKGHKSRLNKGKTKKVYIHLNECSSWNEVDKRILYSGFGTESERARCERWYQIEYNSVTNGLNHSWATKDMTKSQMNKWYRDVNAETLASKKKQYCVDNKEKIASYKKQYNKDNKEALSSHYSTKIPCDLCGTIVRRDNMTRHKKTKKCRSKRLITSRC